MHSQWLLFRDAAEQLGEVIKLRAGAAKDPLLDAIAVLEFNYRNARFVLQKTRHMLMRLFLELFKKKEILAGNLRWVVDSFEKGCRGDSGSGDVAW
jgi:hypothetical protein